MKITPLFSALTLLLVLLSCSQPKKESSITGRWRLEKEERRPANDKAIEYANQPTYVILKLDSTGYFLLYDTFIDPSWKSKGLPLIAERSKGQWKLEGTTLKLNHETDDTTYTETLKVSEVNDKILVTEGQDHKSNVFKTYGR